MWDFKNGNFDQFRMSLADNNWEECFETDDINIACERWSDTFLNIARETVNTKNVTVRPGDKPWYNNYLRHLCLVKDRDHTVWVHNKTEERWERYTISRNFYFEEVDRLRDEYDDKMHKSIAEESLKNPKKWWSLVNVLMGNTKAASYPSLVKDGEIYDTDKGKAEAFNATYIESQDLPDDGARPPLGDPPLPDYELLTEITVTEQDVKDVLSTIDANKAYGPDGVSPKLIKEAGTSIVGVLTRLFNKSLELGKFPTIWKRANVIPIFKKAEKYIASNYRPVSLLSILAKVFEKIIFKYLFNYFRDHFMISIWQSGFLPGSSTVTQLIEIYDQFCKAVSKGKEIRVVFLDISKAFDRVWHRGFLYKIKKCGITGKLLDWLQDYLIDRQQRVIINGQASSWGNIKAGVPQESVLGPLLFLIFINDLTDVVKHCKIRLFADDTCLFIEVDDPDTTAQLINDDLDSIQSWADKWRVTFSPPKTEELLVSRKRIKSVHPPLYLDVQPIKRVTKHKHLGVTLSNDLSWNAHIGDILTKATKRLGIIRLLKFKLDRLSLERIYKCFIRPVLEYADCVWDIPNPANMLMESLEKFQLNAARIVSGATAKCSTARLYLET
jgi:hypothetical protein